MTARTLSSDEQRRLAIATAADRLDPVLLRAALDRTTLTYKDAAAACGWGWPTGHFLIRDVLELLLARYAAAGEPVLTTYVVEASTGECAPGGFDRRVARLADALAQADERLLAHHYWRAQAARIALAQRAGGAA